VPAEPAAKPVAPAAEAVKPKPAAAPVASSPAPASAEKPVAAPLTVLTPPAATRPAAEPVAPAAAKPEPAQAPAPSAPAPAAPAASPVAPPVAAAPAGESSTAAQELDLNALKDQLRETKAIGLMTKLTLKNQVDDLLDKFRDYYEGKAKVTLKELRRSYDLLMMKVLTLLQDADQKLASAIVSSREAIWGLLADQEKFETLQG